MSDNFHKTLNRIKKGIESGYESFSLTKVGLATIPKLIGEMKTLKTLDFGFNDIAELPGEIGNLENLEYLFLESNLIETIPKEIFKLKKLKKLNLYNNNIKSISTEIGQLVNLRSLILGKNQISNLPEEIFQLPNLKDLIIFDNHLAKITIPKLQVSNIRKLGLNHNQILQLPENILQLSKLKDIYLQGNMLNSLPLALAKLNIVTLEIFDNPFSEMPELKKVRNTYEVIKILNKRRNKIISRVISIPKEYKLALKQYFLYFKDFVKSTTGEELFLTIQDSDIGLVFEMEYHENLNIDKINEKINEYMEFAFSGQFNIKSDKSLSGTEADIIILNLKNQISHLKNSFEIAKQTIKFQDDKLNYISDENLFLRNITKELCGYTQNINNELKRELKKMLANAETQNVIDRLMSEIIENSEEYNEIILLNSIHNRINTENRIGKLNSNELSIKLNKLNSSILEFMDKYL